MRKLAFAIGTMLLTGCPAGFVNLCDNDACDSADGSMTDAASDSIIPPPNCDLTKDPRDSQSCVADTVGIFVSPTGADTNPGTKELPVLTIAKGISLTGALKRVYVCTGTYAEDLSLDATHDGVSIYGGWLCQTWGYQASAQPLIGKSNNSAKISGLTLPIFIEDLAITAADGVNPGDSSVAVLVANAANVTFARVTLTAGVGQDGAAGTLTSYTYPTQAQLNGNSSTGIDGGSPITVPCPAGDSTTGGGGGYGNGSDGQDGTPGPSDKGTAVACIATGTSGGNGANGGVGADAPAVSNVGTLSTAWAPSGGGSGAHGTVGQGGGGGGGYGNGGGGGGGGGGCGGAGGGGGGGGGGSIALAVISSTAAVNASTLAAQTPGNGAAGVSGQNGQTIFGLDGTGTPPSCNGGKGGTGGNGGAGAGGAGGVSVGILWKGTQPNVDAATMGQIMVASQGGTKGTGGNPGVNDGIAGIAMPVLQSP